MTPFFSRTGTRRNLTAARAAGWGILVSAAGVWRDEGFPVVGADNGQWSERENPLPFKAERFLRFVDWLGERAQWLLLPDVPFRGLESLALTLEWLPKLRGHSAILLIAVQNGVTPAMIAPFLGPRVGIFVAGDTEWKEASLPLWGTLAREAGCHLHVGRVNTVRRIRICAAAGVDSFDGSSVTRYAETLPPLDFAAREDSLLPRMSVPSERTPLGFARRCREIVALMPGHAAHRALDLLTNDLLRDLGYGSGIDVFEAAVADWHRIGLPYPVSDGCADMGREG